MGIGTTLVHSSTKLGILGGVAIGGQTYSDAQAPTNGLIVEGNIGVGTTNPQYPLHFRKDIAGRAKIYIDNINSTTKSAELVLSSNSAALSWSMGTDYLTNGTDDLYVLWGGSADVRMSFTL